MKAMKLQKEVPRLHWAVAANVFFTFHYQECHELKNALEAA